MSFWQPLRRRRIFGFKPLEVRIPGKIAFCLKETLGLWISQIQCFYVIEIYLCPLLFHKLSQLTPICLVFFNAASFSSQRIPDDTPITTGIDKWIQSVCTNRKRADVPAHRCHAAARSCHDGPEHKDTSRIKILSLSNPSFSDIRIHATFLQLNQRSRHPGL